MRLEKDLAVTSAVQTTPIARRGVRGFLTSPVLAPLLRQRACSAILAAAGVLQVFSALAGFTLTYCPLLHVVGIPCPGCGASRGCAALLRGEWGVAMRWHAFAPFFLLSIAFFAIAAVLPAKLRDRFVGAVERVERSTGLVTLALIAALFYWGIRMSYDPFGVARMMKN